MKDEQGREAEHGRVNVLVLEDNPGDARWLQAELAGETLLDVHLTVAATLAEGLGLLSSRRFHAVLLDLNLPDSRGMDTFARVRAAAPELPLVVYTGVRDDKIGVRVLRSGAQDYFVKGPGMGPLLIRTISFAIERQLVRVELDLRAERLEASRATLRRIVEDSPNVILIIDLAGSVCFVNRAATRLFGLAEPDLVERLGSFAIPCDASEIEIERQDGTSRTTEVRSVEIEWEGAQASLITLHDVTEHKQLQKQVEAENALLEQSVQERTEKLLAANAELETFARSVSHDLRAPVRHIKGFAEMLVEEAGGALSDSAQELLQRIIRSADRMQMLIDDLLGFSLQARGTLCWERVSLGPLLSDVIEELAPEAAHRTVEWQIGDLPAVHADPSLLRLVLMNLLSNALKFTRTRDPARIEVFAVSGPPEPVIAVRDNGAGFDPRQAGRLFGAFQRLHSQAEFEGTGIGLATVRRIVTRHGGRVWAEGRPCEGATFFFTIGITP